MLVLTDHQRIQTTKIFWIRWDAQQIISRSKGQGCINNPTAQSNLNGPSLNVVGTDLHASALTFAINERSSLTIHIHFWYVLKNHQPISTKGIMRSKNFKQCLLFYLRFWNCNAHYPECIAVDVVFQNFQLYMKMIIPENVFYSQIFLFG